MPGPQWFVAAAIVLAGGRKAYRVFLREAEQIRLGIEEDFNGQFGFAAPHSDKERAELYSPVMEAIEEAAYAAYAPIELDLVEREEMTAFLKKVSLAIWAGFSEEAILMVYWQGRKRARSQ